MSHRDPRRPTTRDPAGRDADPTRRPRPPREVDGAGSRRPSTEPVAPSRSPRTAEELGLAPRRDPRPATAPVAPGEPNGDPRGDLQRRSAPAPPPDARAGGGRSPRGTAASAGDDPTDPSAWDEAGDEWLAGDEEWDDVPAADVQPRPAFGRRRPRDTARGRYRARHPAARPARVPGFVAASDLLADRIGLGLLAANIFSLAVMAAVLSSQLGELPDALVIHLDAAGAPDRWAASRVLWRLPLLAGMSTAINLVIAWFVSPLDRFAARFALASALVVHLIAWVAVFDLV